VLIELPFVKSVDVRGFVKRPVAVSTGAVAVPETTMFVLPVTL
jgi:hypothetical protein